MGSLHDFDAVHWGHEPRAWSADLQVGAFGARLAAPSWSSALRFMESLHVIFAAHCAHEPRRSGAPASGTASCCASVVAQTAVSAVSRVANPLAVRRSNASPISNRRYGRLATCATEHRFMESLHAFLARIG